MTNERSRWRRRGWRGVLVALVPLSLSIGGAARGADAASLELFHGPDEPVSMRLRTLRIVLDGTDLHVPAPGADAARALYAGTVAPGPHVLEVEASLESASSLFSYLDGYRVKVRSRLELELLAGEGVSVRSRILPRGGITAPWTERNRLVLTLTSMARAAQPAEVAASERESSAPEPPAPAAPAPAPAPVTAVTAEPAATPVAAAVAAEPAATPAPAPVAAEPAATRVPVAAEPAATPAPSPAPTRPPPAEPLPAPDRRLARASAPAEEPPPRAGVAIAPARDSPAGACAAGPLRFEFDRAALSPAAREELGRFAACVAASALRVRVEGHTDAIGDDEYNRWLAWDRAAAVSAYLRAQGLPHGRVTTRFAGKGRPLCQEATPACFARNRRVELVTAR